ncbi:MAG: hypothetical protein ACLRVX_08550, partial [Faecalibacterium sp.]
HPNQFFIFFQREPLHPVRCGGFFWFSPGVFCRQNRKTVFLTRTIFEVLLQKFTKSAGSARKMPENTFSF